MDEADLAQLDDQPLPAQPFEAYHNAIPTDLKNELDKLVRVRKSCLYIRLLIGFCLPAL